MKSLCFSLRFSGKQIMYKQGQAVHITATERQPDKEINRQAAKCRETDTQPNRRDKQERDTQVASARE